MTVMFLMTVAVAVHIRCLLSRAAKTGTTKEFTGVWQGRKVSSPSDDAGVPFVIVTTAGEKAHLADCGHLSAKYKNFPLCRHCLARGGVRNS